MDTAIQDNSGALTYPAAGTCMHFIAQRYFYISIIIPVFTLTTILEQELG